MSEITWRQFFALCALTFGPIIALAFYLFVWRRRRDLVPVGAGFLVALAVTIGFAVGSCIAFLVNPVLWLFRRRPWARRHVAAMRTAAEQSELLGAFVPGRVQGTSPHAFGAAYDLAAVDVLDCELCGVRLDNQHARDCKNAPRCPLCGDALNVAIYGRGELVGELIPVVPMLAPRNWEFRSIRTGIRLRADYGPQSVVGGCAACQVVAVENHVDHWQERRLHLGGDGMPIPKRSSPTSLTTLIGTASQ